MSKTGDVTEARIIKCGNGYIIHRERDTSFEEGYRIVFQMASEFLQSDGTWQTKLHVFPLHKEVQP